MCCDNLRAWWDELDRSERFQLAGLIVAALGLALALYRLRR